MKPCYDQSLRVPGGINYSSAMFRVTASPEVYSQRLAESLIQKKGLSDIVTIYTMETAIIIAVNDVPKIIKHYDFIESKRQEGVYAYEEWLEKVINALIII